MKRSTLVALALLAALGGYVYWFETEPEPEIDGERVFDVEESAVTRIELRDHDDPPVVLEKTEDAWRLVEPVEAEADATEVDLLLQNLTTLGYERAVASASEADLGAFGLDEPGVRLRFTTESGEELGLDFGSDTPTTGNQYALRAGGEEILVLASYLSNNFQRTPWDLRDKAVFDLPEDAEATRIEVDRPGGRVVLSREGGFWQLLEPFRARADRIQTTELADRFRRAEMAEVVSESPGDLEPGDLEEVGLDEPRLTLRVELEGEAGPLELEIGDERELEVYARTPSRPQVFLVDETYASDLEKEPTEFVSKRLLETAVGDVTAITVGALRLERRGDEDEASWHQTAPEEEEIPASAVEDLLFELSATRAETVLDEAALEELGLGEPDHALTLRWGEPELVETLRVWKREDGPVYARREGDDVGLELTLEDWLQVEALMSLED